MVRLARLAAVLGRPMPTKQERCPANARAAATVIISSAVQLTVPPGSLRGAARRRGHRPTPRPGCAGASCGSSRAAAPLRSRRVHLPVQPRGERGPVAADRVPFAVGAVVPVVVALRVGRAGATGYHR